MKQMFLDKNGDLSAKRIAGVVLMICAIVYTGLGLGDPELVKTMFYSGAVCLGVTAFEKKL